MHVIETETNQTNSPFEGLISIADWLDYDPEIGTDSLQVIGFPRSGKSNMCTGLYAQCIDWGEFLVMPGDRFCEWRHFPYHPLLSGKSLTVLVPEGVDIYYHGFKKNNWFVDIDYDDINIFDFLSKKKPLLVIYDSHLKLLDGTRTNLWVKLYEQALNRREHLDHAIGYLFHEAGNHFQEGAEGNHWKAIKDFQELFVEGGKGLIRPCFVSQLLTEVKSTIRAKCLYNVFRKSYLSHSSGYPPEFVKVLPYTPIDSYHIIKGRGVYKRNNVVNYFYENKSIWKMIPPSSIYGGTPNGDDGDLKIRGRDYQTKIALKKSIMTLLSQNNASVTKVSQLSGLAETTIRKYRDMTMSI